MNGVAEDILHLYNVLIGEEQEEDLSDVWPVQLGIRTELLNVDWFERKQKVVVSGRGAVISHPYLPWACATLDGWVEAPPKAYPLECKHVGGREPLEVIISRYQPQLQFQMACTSAKQCALSVIMGANEPVIEFIDRDDAYIEEMIKRGKKFMTCVAARLPPVTLPAVPPPIPFDQMIEVDMSADASWKTNAEIWRQCYGAAKSAKDAEQVLKNLIADNVRKAWGNGVQNYARQSQQT